MRKVDALEETPKAEAGFLEPDLDVSFCDLGKGNETFHCYLPNNPDQSARER